MGGLRSGLTHAAAQRTGERLAFTLPLFQHLESHASLYRQTMRRGEVTVGREIHKMLREMIRDDLVRQAGAGADAASLTLTDEYLTGALWSTIAPWMCRSSPCRPWTWIVPFAGSCSAVCPVRSATRADRTGRSPQQLGGSDVTNTLGMPRPCSIALNVVMSSAPIDHGVRVLDALPDHGVRVLDALPTCAAPFKDSDPLNGCLTNLCRTLQGL